MRPEWWTLPEDFVPARNRNLSPAVLKRQARDCKLQSPSEAGGVSARAA